MFDAYKVDLARLSDLPSIMDLERAGFAPEIVEEESVFRLRLLTFPQGFLVLREAERDQALGYLCSERWSERPEPVPAIFALGHDPLPRHAPEGRVLYLASMTVDPSLRGKGLGEFFFKASLERLAESCAGLSTGILIVNESWRSARRIYESAGFRDSALMPDFFAEASGGSRAAIVMEKNL